MMNAGIMVPSHEGACALRRLTSQAVMVAVEEGSLATSIQLVAFTDSLRETLPLALDFRNTLFAAAC